MAYFQESRSLTYSYIISLPLLITYEILILISQPDPSTAIRLSADIWVKSIFALTGQNTIIITLLVALFLGLFVFFRERHQSFSLKANHFFLMILESLAYAFGLALLISGFVIWLFAFVPESGHTLTRLQQFTLSLGSGLYEELVFRVILVGILFWTFKKLRIRKPATFISAVVIGALLFSAAHYVGTYGDTISLSSFTFRFLFGVALNIILINRGFGIAAWTHSLYNLMLLLIWN